MSVPSSLFPLDGAVSLCAQSHNEAVSDFTHQPLSFIHTANRTHSRGVSDSCGHKHRHRRGSYGWMSMFSFLCPHPLSFSDSHWFAVGALCLLLRLTLSAYPMTSTRDTHTDFWVQSQSIFWQNEIQLWVVASCVFCVGLHTHASAFCRGKTSNIWIWSIHGTCLFQLGNL